MDDGLVSLLRSVDTPTVCNAIEIAQGRRGFNAFTRGTMICSASQAGAIVGYARTAKIAASAPPATDSGSVREKRMDYYRYMATGPQPALAVVEDTDFPNAVGAFWGEINATVHRGFGLAGALTNGVVRDLGAIPADFPIVAGSIGPSHAFVHVREVGTEVSVFGLKVRDGDLVHADRHGAVVIPQAILPTLADAIDKLTRTERLILDPARAENFSFEIFEKAWAEFEAART